MASQTPEEAPIRFKDAVGRKFTFPFELAKTWQGMEELIKYAFMHVDVIGPQVQQGFYDVMGPEGEIILPLTWNTLIKPGMSITMTLWPMDNPPPWNPPVPVPRPPNQSTFNPPRPPMMPRPPNPPVLNRPGPPAAPEVISVVKPSKTKKQPDTLLSFLTGKPAKKKPDGQKLYLSAGVPGVKPVRPPAFGVPPPQAPPVGDIPKEPRPQPATAARPTSPSVSSSSSSSGSRSSIGSYVESRGEARSAGLVIHGRRRTDERRIPNRQLTNAILEPNPIPTERIELSSARVYPDEQGSSPGVALELTRYSSPPGPTSTPEGERITWAHVSRSVMDLAEFEHIALHAGIIKTTPDSRSALESLFRTLNDKKLMRCRDNWFIQPGTVLRSDLDSGGEAVASATFVSVPQLQVDPLSSNARVKFRKGVCMPRQLHESFDPYDTSFERDKNQLFRKEDGAKEDSVLWVCETWVLIVDSNAVITYGDPRRRLTLQRNIDIREPAGVSDEKFVHVTTPEHIQFQIPLRDCETFFKLQSSVQHQLKAVTERLGPEFDDFFLLDAAGENLTAKNWSDMYKKARDSPVYIRVGKLDDGSSSSSSSKSLSSFSSGSGERIIRIVDDWDDDDEGFFGMEKIASESDLDAFTLPELHPEVPPFLGWSILDAKSSSKDLHESKSRDAMMESVRACLVRTETALVEQRHPHVADLQRLFATLEFNTGLMHIGVENIDLHIQGFAQKKLSREDPNRELSKLYREYLLASIRALEAFAPKDHPSPVLSLYYDALSKGTQYAKVSPFTTKSSKCVVSRRPTPLPGYKYSHEPLGTDCDDCEKGIIYEDMDAAVDHLRREHFSKTTSEARLREHLLPLPEAAYEGMGQEYITILSVCRDMMVDITKQAREIQEGVVFNTGFRQPAQGVPYALLRAFQLLLAHVCAVPILLDAIHTFYIHDVFEEARTVRLPSSLSNKWLTLKGTDSEVAALMKAAERALITSTESRKKDDVANFFSTVGAHGLALQMMSNLVLEPVYNNSNAVEIYRRYVTNLGSQVIRRPSKRQIPLITALMDELNRLQEVTKWQQQMVHDIQVVFSPETHLEPLDEERKKTNAMELYIIHECQEKLQEQLDMVTSNLERGTQLIGMVGDMTEIMKDDHSRAIFVFTVVTVIFLPLSFVAAYLSMNGGPSEADSWAGTQRLFWQIASPLAVGVGVFCLVVAWPRAEVQAARDWVVERAVRVRGRISRTPITVTSESSTGEVEEKVAA